MGIGVALTITIIALPLLQSRWKQDVYVLATFWDPPYGSKTLTDAKSLENFHAARKAHFNLLTGVQGEDGIDHTFEGMKRALSLASEAGLSYLVSDNRVYEACGRSFDGNTGKAVINDYLSLPSDLRKAHYGYMLCDEPRNVPSHRHSLAQWKKFVERSDETRLVYYNLAPSYAADNNWGGFHGGNNDGLLQASERLRYEAYLDFYIDSLRPSVVSFDHYPFFKDGKIRRDYFYNLQSIREHAGETPFWAFAMTTDHLDYVDPREEHINFMYFCPIAYGAKGILVFTYWPPPYQGYRKGLFDQQGERTTTYETVKRLNRFVSEVIAPVVMRTTSVEVHHKTAFPDDQMHVKLSSLANSPVVSSIGDDRILVGVFRDLTNMYLLVVNKSLSSLKDATVGLRGVVPYVYFGPRLAVFADDSLNTYARVETKWSRSEQQSLFKIPELTGGEGRLVRFRH